MITGIGIIVALGGVAQTVTNGSCTGTVGNSQGQNLPGWVYCSSPANNSPDVLNLAFASWNGGTTVTPADSPDGGSWIGLANGINPIEQECMTGQMTGLVVGTSYALQFQGACFGTGSGSYANGSPFILTVTIDGASEVFSIPMAASVWNNYFMCFIATSSNMSFTMQTLTGGGFGSLDGFTVAPGGGSVEVLADTVLCPGATLVLDPGVTNATYVWNDGSTDPTYEVTEAGLYWVEITTACGTSTDSVEVTLQTIETLDLGPDASLCPEDQITIMSNVAGDHLWQDGSTGTSFTAMGPGTYWVDVQGTCTSLSDTVIIVGAPLPVVDLGPDTAFCSDAMWLLNAYQEGAQYVWQDQSIGPTFSATQAGTYNVVVDLAGCIATDSVELAVLECETILEMPNVFTPNSDGSNDFFVPVRERNLVSSELRVFNRWGQVVYENKDVRRGWSGRGEWGECPDGTYYWEVRYVDHEGAQNHLTGHVTLLR